MEQERALIDDLADPEMWIAWFNSLVEWLVNSVLSIDTIVSIVIVIGAAALAWPISKVIGRRLAELSLAKRLVRYPLLKRLLSTTIDIIFPICWLVIQWISLVITSELGVRNTTIFATTSLLMAWIIIRYATTFVSNHLLSRIIAVTAWIVAALRILGFLDQTLEFLDNASISLGQVSISALTIIQAIIALGILLWLTTLIGQVIEGQVKNSNNLTPSIKVLSTKLLRIGLVAFALLTALSIVGVDLTALAVFGGAIGVGLGFGLQKIFANLVSGFILLLDKSIKPGDVIVVPGYYGRVDSLGARYVSVTTRDGIEHLIPNEELIINRVENWSHSNNLLRLRKKIGVHYKADVRKAIRLCLEAAAETPRILDKPDAACLMSDYGESSVDLEIRFWINDPMAGRANVTSELLLRVWDKFAENGIEIPYPQRDLHFRSSDIEKLPLLDDSDVVYSSQG